MGGRGSLSSAQGHLDKAPSQVTRQPSAAVANCLGAKSNAGLEQGVAGGGEWGRGRSSKMVCQGGASPDISGKVSSHLDTCGGVRQRRPLSRIMAI